LKNRNKKAARGRVGRSKRFADMGREKKNYKGEGVKKESLVCGRKKNEKKEGRNVAEAPVEAKKRAQRQSRKLRKQEEGKRPKKKGRWEKTGFTTR